jgi:hypothetical protein
MRECRNVDRPVSDEGWFADFAVGESVKIFIKSACFRTFSLDFVLRLVA